MTATQMIGVNLLSVPLALFAATLLAKHNVPQRTADEVAHAAVRMWPGLSLLAIITEWGLWLLL
jgi:ABC-type Fe3+ transport system permease subunit